MTHRPINQIESDLRAAGIARNKFRAVHNEGQGGYADETEIERLTAELRSARAAASPLATREGIQAEREWAKAKNWTAKDLQAANNACRERGYSLADLQAAIKTL
jgi:hypothetical protein